MSRPVSYTTAVTLNPTSYTASNANYTKNGNSGCTNSASTTYATLSGSTSTRYYTTYSFNPQIPQNATINSVVVYGKGRVYSGSYPASAATYSNTTQKSSFITINGTTTATTAMTFVVSGGSWTSSEVSSLGLRIYHPSGNRNARYCYFYGADAVINYSVQGTEYEVSFDNQSSDVTTDPSTSQYVFQGGEQIINFYGISNLSDVNIKDNNTLINSSLVRVTVGPPPSQLSTAPNASYGFALDSSDGYYKSQNKGIDKSAAVCRISVTATEQCTLTLNFINYAEATYDYGIIGKVDASLLTTSAVSDTSNWLWAGSASTNNTSTEKTTAITISSGVHFIDIKYRKDDATSSNNDDFRFKYSISDVQLDDPYYRYTISNIAADHVISIEDAGGTFYNVNASSTYTGATVSPTTQSIREGRNATVNISVDNLYEIKVKDNNVDVTSSVSEPQPSETTTFIPSSYDSSLSTAITGTTYPPSNGLSNTGSTSYAIFSGIQATSAYAYYDFSTTEIPDGAIITSVECVVRTRTSSTSRGRASVQLYSGSNPKGSATEYTTTTTTNFDLNCGTWTLEELRNAKLGFIFYQTGTTSYSIRLYGANLVVTYYIPASYTITNVQTAHTIVVEQAPTYAISVSSTYTGATIATSQSTVYQGRGATLTLSVNNLYEVVVKDNGTDITSNFTGNNGTYRYGLSNIQTAHTIVVEEAPYYYVDASSTNTGLTAQPSQQKVYAGQSATVTFNGNFNDTTVKDNNNDVTSQLITVNQNTKTYTIQNVSTGHTVVISKRINYAKVSGVFMEIKKYFIKVNGEWSAMTLTEFVTNNINDIHMYGGHISGVVTTIVGEVVNDSNDTYIEISDNALPSGTYKLIYEDENRHTLQDIDKITEFTIN